MRMSHMLFRVALLGSTLAVAALAPAAGANLSRADWERIRAATGVSASQPGSAAASGISTASRPPGTYKVLHNFAGPPNDGGNSGAEVTLDSAGNIYGTTDYGGANSAGTIFKLTPGGTETLLHSFGGTGDGTTPDGAVFIDPSTGDIYGTTESGGSANNGVIYKLTAGGTYSVLHSFTSNEGSFIRGRLVRDKKGNFYGTALFGGVNSYGTVFKYSTHGKLTVLHAFTNTDGEYPEHGVVRDPAGNLFGVTAFGGTSGNGTVYKIARDGTFTSLYSFSGGANGDFLYGSVDRDRNDNLYGSTVSGGANGAGTVFKLTPGGTLTTLYNFTGGADGGGPNGNMLLVGNNLYSIAGVGGGTCGCGAVYEVKASGKEKVLHAFAGGTADGAAYAAGLTLNNSVFYGTTSSAGANGYGIVFSVK